MYDVRFTVFQFFVFDFCTTFVGLRVVKALISACLRCGQPSCFHSSVAKLLWRKAPEFTLKKKQKVIKKTDIQNV